jgi:diguanylate cyclase (GGDEF)-like protein
VSTFRTSDIIGRMGGDEFVCLLPNAADMTEAQVKSRLEARLAQLSSDLQEEFPVTAAIGLATAAPMVTVELDALVREADRALYGAKHARLEDDLATPPVGQPNRLR